MKSVTSVVYGNNQNSCENLSIIEFRMHSFIFSNISFKVIPSEGSDTTQSIIIENNSSTQIDIPADQSEVQSANALLHLATSHNSGGDYQGNIENLSESRSKVKVITEKQV